MHDSIVKTEFPTEKLVGYEIYSEEFTNILSRI